MFQSRKTAAIVAALALVPALAACGGDDDDDSGAAATTATTSATTATPAGTSLKESCPATIVVQTDWNPEADHSELYELAADGGKIDNGRKRYTADLVSQGRPTGVKIEIRAGGPATGFQNPTPQMYQDKDILLGYVNTDEAVRNAAKQPTTTLIAPRENWAQILMFDPNTYDFKTIADIGKTDTKVLYFQGGTYMSYLTGAGILKKSQIDSSYDGKPARFVTSGGKVVQQGFISAEPYSYENTIKQWGKKVSSLLISEAGYPNYGEALATRPENVTKYADCFKKLIPMIQQAQVDYAADPARANALIVKLVPGYKTGWVYPDGLATFGHDAQLENKIIDNGDDDTLGDVSEERVQKMIDLLKPIYAKQNIKIPADLAPSDLYTNEFIEQGIGLPAAGN